jgi:hypothetical protein
MPVKKKRGTRKKSVDDRSSTRKKKTSVKTKKKHVHHPRINGAQKLPKHHLKEKSDHEKIADQSSKKDQQIPKSVWVLIYYSLIIALGYVGLSYFTSFSLVLGYLFTGIFAKVINLLFALLICAMAYGFYYKKRYAYNLSIFVYVLSIISPIISIVYERFNEAPHIYSFKSRLFYFFVLSVALNGLTLWYIYKKRDYFFRTGYDMHREHVEDRVLKISMSVIAAFCILFVLFGGIYLFSTITPKIDSINADLEGMGVVDSISFCYQDDSVDDENLCLLVVAAKNRDSGMASVICSEIDQQADFYKEVCNMVIER